MVSPVISLMSPVSGKGNTSNLQTAGHMCRSNHVLSRWPVQLREGVFGLWVLLQTQSKNDLFCSIVEQIQPFVYDLFNLTSFLHIFIYTDCITSLKQTLMGLFMEQMSSLSTWFIATDVAVTINHWREHN